MTKYEQLKDHLRTNQYTWLVTGVAGFIGSNLLENLLVLNQKVVGLDNFETGYQHNIDQAIQDAATTLAAGQDEHNGSSNTPHHTRHPGVGRDPVLQGNHPIANNFTLIQGDIKDLETCNHACSGVDFVLHQAALGSVPRSIEDPIKTNGANIDGFLNMLVAARDAKVKSFVYAASSSTYGDHPDLPKVEDKIGNPLSPYAVTKVVNELYANVFARTYGFNTIGLRYFNIFGKRQDPNGAYAAVIPKWVASILNGEEVFINGDGETSRDFCYIANTVQMNLLAALAEDGPATDQVYNVALNDRTSLNQLYEMIEDLLIQKVDGLKKNSPTYRDFRAGDVRHSLADITKAKQLLGYEPSHRIAEGMVEAMDWYVGRLGG